MGLIEGPGGYAGQFSAIMTKRSSQRLEEDESRFSQAHDYTEESFIEQSDGDDIMKFNNRVKSVGMHFLL